MWSDTAHTHQSLTLTTSCSHQSVACYISQNHRVHSHFWHIWTPTSEQTKSAMWVEKLSINTCQLQIIISGKQTPINAGENAGIYFCLEEQSPFFPLCTVKWSCGFLVIGLVTGLCMAPNTKMVQTIIRVHKVLKWHLSPAKNGQLYKKYNGKIHLNSSKF